MTHSPKRLAAKAVALESVAFDILHRTDTGTPHGEPQRVLEGSQDNFEYLPTRPGKIRKLLRSLPVTDLTSYTFVDFGSGKGRMLLLAAELPFHAVQGVELNSGLHAIATKNIERARWLRRAASAVESSCQNATHYAIPETNLVLYFFNPFGPAVMRDVLRRVITSWESAARDILLIFYSFEYDCTRGFEPWMEVVAKTDTYSICRIKSPS